MIIPKVRMTVLGLLLSRFRPRCLMLVMLLIGAVSPVWGATFAPTTVAELVADMTTANANGEPDTINLGGLTFTLTSIDNFADGDNGLPSVLADGGNALTLDGMGAIIERDLAAGVDFRILHVARGAALILNDVTVRGGVAAAGGQGPPDGGGIYSAGDLTLDGVTITGNTAGDSGGGVFGGAMMTVINSTISANAAVGMDGGGIALAPSAFDASLDVSFSTVSGNTAGRDGGGIAFVFGEVNTFTISDSTISGNAANRDGGGIFNGTFPTTITHCTITDNTADADQDFSGDGGGVFTFAPADVLNSIFAGNRDLSGAINGPGDLTPGGGENGGFPLGDVFEVYPDVSGSFASQGHNIIGDPAGSFGAFNVTGTDIELLGMGLSAGDVLELSLADNGGPTQTHLLVDGSLAIDAVPLMDCVGTVDQRGEPRPMGDDCDIGSFEAAPPAPLLSATLADALHDDPGMDGQANPGDTLRYTAQISNAGNGDSTVTQFSITLGANTTLAPGTIQSTPLAIDDPHATPSNQTLTVDAAGGVLSNDVDVDGDMMTVTAFDDPATLGGAVSVAADGSFDYTPPPASKGLTDTFTYTLQDDDGHNDTATVSIDILNACPIAQNDDLAVDADMTVMGDVLADNGNGIDDDPDGDPISVTLVNGAAFVTGTPIALGSGAMLTMTTGGGFTYDPNGQFPAGGADSFTYTIDDASGCPANGNTATVNLTIIEAPQNATHATVGNTELTAGGFTALGAAHVSATDGMLPAGTILSVTSLGPFASANGGSVTMAADGGFSYAPPAGLTGMAADTFDYTVDTGRMATVTIDISEQVWYVNNDPTDPLNGGGDNGTSTDPFDTLAEAEAASGVGDTIFVFEGDGTATGQDAGITLQDNQQLLGHTATTFGVGAFTVETPGPVNGPLIAHTSGGGGDGITLAKDNTIRGLTIGDTIGTGIVDGVATGSFGTHTVSDVSIIGSGGGIDLGIGTIDMSFDEISATSSTDRGISLIDVGGTFNVSTGDLNISNAYAVYFFQLSRTLTIDVTFSSLTSNTSPVAGIYLQTFAPSSSLLGSFEVTGLTDIDDAAGAAITILGFDTALSLDLDFATIDIDDGINAGNSRGISITGGFQGGTFDATATQIDGTDRDGIHISNSSGTFSFGDTDIGQTNVVDGVGAVNLALNVAGTTITFDSLDITNPNAGGLFADRAGTVNVIGTTTIDGAIDQSIHLEGTGDTTFGAVDIDNRGAEGIEIDGTSGTISFGATTIDGAGGVAAGIDIDATTDGSVTFTSTVAVTGGGGPGISLANSTGGSFQITGATTVSNCAGDGILLSSNAATVTLGDATITGTANTAGNAGLDIEGTSSGPITVGTIDIQDVDTNTAGIDFNGADATFTSDATTISGNSDGVGIDLDGTLNTRTIQIGDVADPSTDTPSSITGTKIGIAIGAADADFSFGDAEGATDVASTIDTSAAGAGNFAVTFDPGLSSGTYNLQDVGFAASDVSNLQASTLFFVDADGPNDGDGANDGTEADPGGIGQAEAATADAIVLVNQELGGAGMQDTIDAGDAVLGAGGTLDLDDAQFLLGFMNGDTIDLGTLGLGPPSNILTTGLGSGSIVTNPGPAGSGSPRLSTTGVNDTVALASGITGTIFGADIGNGGAGSGILGDDFASLTVQDSAVAGAVSGINADFNANANARTATVTINNSMITGGAGSAANVTSGAGDSITLSVDPTVFTSTGGGGGLNIDASGGGDTGVTLTDITTNTTSGAGLSIDGAGGGTTTVAATGANTIDTTTGTALNLNGITVGTGGINFDTIAVTTGGASDGIDIDTVTTSAGNGMNIGSADLNGHTGRAIDLNAISGAGGFTLTSGDIDLGAGARGVDITGANTGATLAIGNGMSNGISGLDIDGGLTGINLDYAAGTADIASTSSSDSRLRIGNTTRPTNAGVDMGASLAGTVNIGNAMTQATANTVKASFDFHAINATADVNIQNAIANSEAGFPVEITAAAAGATIDFTDLNITGTGPFFDGIVFVNSDAATTFIDLDIDAAWNGVRIGDNNAGGSVTITGASTIDNIGRDGIFVGNANATISGVTFGGSATGVADDITEDAIHIRNTDNTARTVSISEITIGSDGDTNNVAGRGIVAEQAAGAGVLTVNLSGANEIHTTGHALETQTQTLADVLVLDVTGATTFETGSSGPAVEINGDSISATQNSTIVSDFAGVEVIGNGAGGGILFDNVTFDSNIGNGIGTTAATADQVSFGATQVGQSTAARVVGDGLSLLNPIGDVSVATLNIFNDTGTGLEVNTKGAGTDFNLATGAGTINTTNGPAMFLDPLTTDIDLDSVSSTNIAAAPGIVFDQVSGTVDITSATVNSTPSNSISISDSPGTFTFGSVDLDGSGQDGINASNSGSVVVNGGNIDSISDDAIEAVNTNLTVALLSLGANGVIGDEGIVVANSDASGRTASITNSNIGLPNAITDRGIVVTSSGAGALTATLTGNAINSLDHVIETVDGGTAGSLVLDLQNSTLTTADSVPTQAHTGSGLNSTIVRSWTAPNQVIGGAGGGILFGRVTFDASGAALSGTQVVLGGGGQLDIGSSGARAQGDGLSFINPTGDLSIPTLNIFNNNGTGLEVDTKGLGTTFNLATGAGTINTTGGPAMFLDPLTANMTLTSVTVDANNAMGSSGIVLDTVEGAFQVTGAIDIRETANAGIDIRDNTGGGTLTVDFDGATTIDNATVATAGGGVSITNSSQATINFSGGLDIDTTTGAGFNATGGGTVNVSASAGDESINTTTGQGINLNGVTVGATGISFDSVGVNGAATGIALNGISSGGGNFNPGATNLQNVTSRGVDITGALPVAVAITDLDISLNNTAAVGLDMNGATINASVTANDFDITNNAAAGTSIGIDVAGATGSGTIQLGDTNTNGGADASIAGTNSGVQFSSTTNLPGFTFGDGSGVNPDGPVSTINAVTPITTTNSLPANGSYDFEDVTFTGDVSNLGGPSTYFINQVNGGSGTSVDPGNISGAEASGADVYVLIDTNTNSASDNIDASVQDSGTFNLPANTALISYHSASTAIDATTLGISGGGAPPSFSFTTVSSSTVVPVPAGLDSVFPTLTSSGANTTLDVPGNAGIQDVRISNTGSGIGINVTGGGTVNVLGGLNLATNSGIGFSASGGGTINLTATAGDELISSVGGKALDLDGVTVGITFDSVSSAGSANEGIDLDNVSGSLTINGGIINTAAGTAFDLGTNGSNLSGGDADITFAGGIANTTGRSVNIQERTGGTVTLSGPINETGTGILVQNNNNGMANTITFSGATKTINTGANTAVNLTSNANATINFTNGGLDIDTTSGTGFNATGGGTVNVSGAGNTITTVETAGGANDAGQAVVMNGVTIGASDMTFATISATNVTAANDALSFTNVSNAGTFNGGNVVVTEGDEGIDISGSSAAFNYTSATIDNTGGDGINLNGANGVVTFIAVDIDGAAAAGIQVTNNTNAVTVSGGTIGATNDPAGNAVDVSGGTANVIVAAALTKTTAGRIVEVTGRAAGTVTISGSLSSTGTGTGINVANNTGGTTTFSGTTKTVNTGANTAVTQATNTGHTINFTGGGLDIDTTSGTGLFATGGGTVTVQGTGNTVTTTTGTGVNVVSTTIGAVAGGPPVLNTGTGVFSGNFGMTFQSVNVNGSTQGIILNNAGSGGFNITGAGATDGSGGTIQNTNQDGIEITSTNNIQLANLNLTRNAQTSSGATDSVFSGNIANYFAALKLSSVDSIVLNNMDIDGGETGGGINNNDGETGISGRTVSDFFATDVTVENFGLSSFECNVQFQRLTGAVGLTNFTSQDSGAWLFAIQNKMGDSLTLDVDNGLFRETVNGNQRGGLVIDLNGSGTTAVTVINSAFGNGIRADEDGGLQGNAVHMDVGGNHVGSLTVQDSVFDGVDVGILGSLDTGGANPRLTMNIGDGADGDTVGNTITNVRLFGIYVYTTEFLTAGQGVVNATITDNVIGQENVSISGSEFDSGISASNEGGGSMTLLIDDNIVQGVGDIAPGIQTGFEGIIVTNSNTASTLNATITNNAIRDIFDDRGLQVEQLNAGGTTCSNISGNTFSATIDDENPLTGTTRIIRVRQTAGTHNVVQTSQANLASVNGVASGNITVTGTINFSQPACTTP